MAWRLARSVIFIAAMTVAALALAAGRGPLAIGAGALALLLLTLSVAGAIRALRRRRGRRSLDELHGRADEGPYR